MAILKIARVVNECDIYVQLEGTLSIPAICGRCVTNPMSSTSTQPFVEGLFHYIKGNCPMCQREACGAAGTVVAPSVIQIRLSVP